MSYIRESAQRATISSDTDRVQLCATTDGYIDKLWIHQILSGDTVKDYLPSRKAGGMVLRKASL